MEGCIKRTERAYALELSKLINDYAKLNDVGRAYARMLVEDCTLMTKYTCALPMIDEVNGNIIKVNFGNERRC